ncbi:MAG: fibronectin type III domain-containing protein [Bacteroidetes bacterium]|nr:fibronectin type III domain-containing protein [Bacteroidota bacterium]
MKIKKTYILLRVVLYAVLTFNFALSTFNLLAQSGGAAINTTGTAADNSAMLDVSSTTQGVLISRMTTAQRDAIGSPAQGLVIYNLTTKCFEFYENGGWYNMGCVCTPPNVPVAITGSGATSTQITANWNAALGTTHYHLDVSTSSSFSSYITGFNNQDVSNVTTYNVTDLTCETTYYYRVRAENTCGSSGNSNTITYATSNCCTASGWTYVQNFNALNTGALNGQDGWSDAGLQGIIDVVTTGTPYEGAKHVEFAGSTSGSSSEVKTFTGVSNGTFYVSMKGTATTSSAGYLLFALISGSDYAIQFGLNNGNIWHYPAGISTSIQAYSANTYYRIGIQFETGSGGWQGLAADTYKININNGAWSSAQPFSSVSGALDNIRMYSYSKAGELWYLDDISFCP